MQSPGDTISNLVSELVLPPDSLEALIKNVIENTIKSDDSSILPYLVQILDTVVWPAVVLIILYAFKQEFGGIFNRAKSLKMGAGGIEIETFEKTLQKTKTLANLLATSDGTSKSFAPPPDPFGPKDPRMIVSKVQLDLDKKLRKKANANKIKLDDNLDTKGINSKLSSMNILSNEEHLIVDGIVELAENVMAGHRVTEAQATEILEIYNKLP